MILKQKYIPLFRKYFKGFHFFYFVEKTRLNGYVYEFSVHYNVIDTSNTIVIHKYLMKKYDIK